MAEEEKLKNHLHLLRQEYVKLQQKLVDLKEKYDVAVAAQGEQGEDNFVARLLAFVADLFDKDLYSDLTIQLDGQEIKAHRFVLAARSQYWGVADLQNVQLLDFSGIPHEVGMILLQWVYTDKIDLSRNDEFILELLRAACKFRLDSLQTRCEEALIGSVNVKNCINYYQTAEEISAAKLKSYCSEIITSHWDDFTIEDFVGMSAPLLYKMFKSKTAYPLHAAIRNKREDIVFLYLMEFDAQLPAKLNEIDTRDDLPLDLALSSKQQSVAEELVKHKVDVDRPDSSGCCLLHKAIRRGDEFAALFLINNGATVNAATYGEMQTPLHLTASFSPNANNPVVIQNMVKVAELLLQKGANTGQQDFQGNTVLHCAVSSRNQDVFNLLLSQSSLNLDIQNAVGDSALWMALDNTLPNTSYGSEGMAAKLIQKGCNPDSVHPKTGDTLLHRCSRAGNEEAALFLANHGASFNLPNNKGETSLHVASSKGQHILVRLLLQKGANPNIQTLEDINASMDALGFQDTNEQDLMHASKQTPLHIAIANRHEEVVTVFMEHRGNAMLSMDGLQIIPNFTLADSNDQTVLGLALWTGMHDLASKLLHGGADINHMTKDGLTLLHTAINKQDADSAIFLLEHQADINIKTRQGHSPLQLAIEKRLAVVVDALCVRGADMNQPDQNGNLPLWMALESEQEEVASILVRHGCDVNGWSQMGPGGCEQTLLHRAIDENKESIACFLIRSLCDVNSPRRTGPNGEGDSDALDGQGPLHMASQWGQEHIVQCLVEHQADINARDNEMQTPLHIAITNQHPIIISLLMSHPHVDLTLRDKDGLTPFAVAMTYKNNKAAQSILDREPRAAEQLDNKGRNFLHIAVQKSDIESVLFLISVKANVNSRVHDNTKYTPLHLAVQAGSEIIVRNLLLAGASVADVDSRKRTALHMAAEVDQPTIASVLIENGVDINARDDNQCNALHTAVRSGTLACVRILLTESNIDAEAFNGKGQTAMHVLGQYGKDNSAAIFDAFMDCIPNYQINKTDVNGNTTLLLAYQNGNGSLARSIVRAGGSLGIMNNAGESIFNAKVATKQLLFKLLDMLGSEPAWSESEFCQECQAKFTIKTRKHHCRHCGRVLCSKCSSKMMPIIKYNLTRPVRVCDICFDVLSLGGLN